MPRRARIAVPGIPWHIIQRGNNRSACFYAEEDYHRYIDTLSDMSPRFDCQIHAYVLMTNHVHLLLIKGVGDKTQSFSFVTDPFNSFN